MNLKLIKIKITNFKGIKSLTIDFNGNNICIYGANATGKTTILDAYLWCLFGKNHKGESAFNIKPIDEKGKIIHRVDSEVELTLSVDDINTTFKKIQTENWVRRRNSEIEELKGNEISYYVDNVPQSAGYYKNYVDSIIKENLFKVLSNPEYFNTVLTWEQRREVITRIAGDITNSDVALQGDDFAKLLDELNGKSLTDKKKEISQLKIKLKDDLANIPARIDECQKKMPETHDVDDIKKQIAENQKAIDNINNIALNKSLQFEQAHKHNAQINALISAKNQEIETVKQAFFAKGRKEVAAANESYYAQQNKIIELKQNIKMLDNDIIYREGTLKNSKRALEELSNKFDELNEKTASFDNIILSCPTCKRPFDDLDIDEKRNEIKAAFNLNKANELKAINEKGGQLKSDIEKNEAELNIKKQYLTAKQTELNTILQNELKMQMYIPNDDSFFATTEFQEISNQLSELKSQIKTITEQIDNSDFTKQKQPYHEAIDHLKAKLMNNQIAQSLKDRIEELNNQLLLINQQIADLEKIENVINRFIKTKISMVEEKVNNMFTYVTFKMYNMLINGNEEPTCEALINGVPYNSANAAAQKNAGIDIINTLSDYYHVNCPIFLDNAESTNQFISSRGQSIKMYVIEPCPTSPEAEKNYKEFYSNQGVLLT
jgi:DNA repair exonuclease SbcCD ATPase subunit